MRGFMHGAAITALLCTSSQSATAGRIFARDPGQAEVLLAQASNDANPRRHISALSQHLQSGSPEQRARAAFLRGREFLDKGQYGKCIPFFDESIRLKSDYVPALTCRGIALRKTGALVPAKRDFDRAIDLDAGYAPAYGQRGLLQRQLGDVRAAKLDLRKCAELDASLSSFYDRESGGLLSVAKGETERPVTSALKSSDGSHGAAAQPLGTSRRTAEAPEPVSLPSYAAAQSSTANASEPSIARPRAINTVPSAAAVGRVLGYAAAILVGGLVLVLMVRRIVSAVANSFWRGCTHLQQVPLTIQLTRAADLHNARMLVAESEAQVTLTRRGFSSAVEQAKTRVDADAIIGQLRLFFADQRRHLGLEAGQSMVQKQILNKGDLHGAVRMMFATFERDILALPGLTEKRKFEIVQSARRHVLQYIKRGGEAQ